MSNKLTYLTVKIDAMEAALQAMKREKEDLLSKVQDQANEIAELRNNLNEREQYARSWSMRCLNIPVPSDSETDTRLVMQLVYDLLIRPILEGAMSKESISQIPSCDSLLETAHILPGKASAKPVIARFYSRYWRNLVFRHRRDFAPREQAAPSTNTRSSGKPAPRMKYPFFEDLTRASFDKLKAIKQHEDVSSAWTVNGTIRFKVQGNETVFRVSSLSDTVESIVG